MFVSIRCVGAAKHLKHAAWWAKRIRVRDVKVVHGSRWEFKGLAQGARVEAMRVKASVGASPSYPNFVAWGDLNTALPSLTFAQPFSQKVCSSSLTVYWIYFFPLNNRLEVHLPRF